MGGDARVAQTGHCRCRAPVRGWAHALVHESTPLARFAALEMPVLLMAGSRSPASGRAVNRILAPALRNVQLREFPELGHMGPITHPDVVNEAVEAFLDRL